LVGLGRVELPTSRLSGVRSNQLSYRPNPGRTHDPLEPKRHSRLKQLAKKSTSNRGGAAQQPNRNFKEQGLAPSQLNRRTLRRAYVIDLDTTSGCFHPMCVAPRKEVIQPQVLLQLPCYDFTPITSHSVGACLPKVSPATSRATSFRDVTGGVYKARERIHPGMLIRDY
jgi:hypothetical protein